MKRLTRQPVLPMEATERMIEAAFAGDPAEQEPQPTPAALRLATYTTRPTRRQLALTAGLLLGGPLLYAALTVGTWIFTLGQ